MVSSGVIISSLRAAPAHHAGGIRFCYRFAHHLQATQLGQCFARPQAKITQIKRATEQHRQQIGPEPPFGRKLLVLAQAFSRVPSTKKCSLESRTFTFGCASNARMNAEADEPAKQKVKVNAFNQLSLRTDRVESLQRQSAEQTL